MKLKIDNLHVAAGRKKILKGVSLTIRQGEIHALMGPNGSGKSTLAETLMGSPHFKITKGRIYLDGRDITKTSPDERSRAGLFLAFQQPMALPGIPLISLLHTAASARLAKPISLARCRKELLEHAKRLKIKEQFLERSLNEGFSGGEKKKAEILQLALLKPKMAILDETDSGLDIDALKEIAQALKKIIASSRGEMGVLLITHYQRILRYIKPGFVHIMISGRIVKSGDRKLAEELERKGYNRL